MICYYPGESNFTCRASEFDDTPVINEILIFEINGIKYARTTDANGTASLPINLNCGEYEIKVRLRSNKYLPCNITNTVNVKNTIIANDLTKDYRDDNQFSH